MKITDVIMDFDGTCTQIPVIYDTYMAEYLTELNKALPQDHQISPDIWQCGLAVMQKYSPQAGWTLANLTVTPSAPAAADPYILSGEAAKYVFKYHLPGLPKSISPSPDAFTNASKDNPAPWRPEAREVFDFLLAQGVRIHFVSNSSTAVVQGRVNELFAGALPPTNQLNVIGNASKFFISEPTWKDIAGWHGHFKELYAKVPAAQSGVDIGRPLYLRRGNFMNIIESIFHDEPERFSTALFVGDIWELDCALPHALGAHTHLITRAEPFHTYPYERELAVADPDRGKISDDLNGIKNWF